MCQQQDMRTQVADPAPVPFSPRGRRARDEGANFTAEIDDFDQGYCTDNCGQTRYRQPSIFGKFDTDQPQWLLPHPRPLSQAGFIFLMKACSGEGSLVRRLRQADRA